MRVTHGVCGVTNQCNVTLDNVWIGIMDPQSPRLDLDADLEMCFDLSIEFGIWCKEFFDGQIGSSP